MDKIGIADTFFLPKKCIRLEMVLSLIFRWQEILNTCRAVQFLNIRIILFGFYFFSNEFIFCIGILQAQIV